MKNIKEKEKKILKLVNSFTILIYFFKEIIIKLSTFNL